MNREFDDNFRERPERRSRRDPKKQDKITITREDGAAFISREKAKPEMSADFREAAAGNKLGTLGSGAGTDGSEGGRRPLNRRDEAVLRRKKKRRRMIGMIIAECFALIFIFAYGFVARMGAMVQRSQSFEISELKTNDIAVEAVENMKGYWNIAVFGVDSRDNSITKSTNADVNLICSINLETGEIKLVSVFRDTYMNISEEGTYNKINQAYFMGGPAQAVQALNRNLDLDITDYATFNWKAVANGIDVLGGVDIELSKAEFYYINSFITETVKVTGIGSHQLTHAGMNHLDGVQAVAYGRLRLMDTDYARTERQRKIIAQAFEKAKKADFQTLYTLIGTVFPQVSTSLWVDDLVNNARNINKFHLGETTGFPQARGDANMGKRGAVVVPQTLESNVIKLHEFLFGAEDYTPSETVKRLSAKIAADTGMYKEGQYVDKVSTEGGVIQPPKTTPARTEAKDEDEDETDEDESSSDLIDESPVTPTAAATDENGDPLETTTNRPGQITNNAPSSTASSTTGQGNPWAGTTGAGGTGGTTAANRPTAPTTDAAEPTSRPGGMVVDAPGGDTTPTAATVGPGANTSTTAANENPGITTTPTTAANQAPTTAAPIEAPTAAPTAAIISGGPGSDTAPTTAVQGIINGPGQ